MSDTEPTPPAAENVQDHLSIADKERNWSLFLFFRVLSNAEVAKQLELAGEDPEDYGELVKATFAAIDPKAIAFYDLPLLLGKNPEGLRMQDALEKNFFLAFLNKLLGMNTAGAPEDIGRLAGAVGLPPPGEEVTNPQQVADYWFGKGLRGICVHEALRYSHTPAVAGTAPLLRSHVGADGARALAAAGPGDTAPATSPYATVPVNIAFTHNGLAALRKVRGNDEVPVIDPKTLVSFPDAFRKGMAARAKSLGDIGASTPANWEGALGKPSVHGMLTAYFPVTIRRFRDWDRVREEVEAFNTGNADLRRFINRLFLKFGFEILHVEFGQHPYELPNGELGDIEPLLPRREHFGFRDGISQPFLDLGLKTPLPGGGTPSKDGTWTPVAGGEIFLGEPDEDGLTADQPVNQALRDGGTYLVFRKLEQDVGGFRAYLEHQRRSPEERNRLAAQFVGRWKDGAPLVRHPDFDASYVGSKAEMALNDFRYRAEDPRGTKCPIGSHVRRVNPRDTGGRNETRYHRILRRSMSYGGPMLPEDAKGDGRSRGLLFIAANARIEMQFEVIQRDWINSGEFLGQVGAGRCPLTGANSGLPQDRFLEGGAIAPISGIPSFVTTKGGDYFFAPSISALRAIAAGDLGGNRKPEGIGVSSGALAETPAMQTQEKIRSFAEAILGPQKVVRIRLPRHQNDRAPDTEETTFAFIGRHADVSKVLGSRPPEGGGPPPFSVAHYLQASREITRGSAQLLAMDEGGPLAAKRSLRLEIMNAARRALKWGTPEHNDKIRQLIQRDVQRIVHRVARSGQVDILQDLAFYVAYRLVQELVGISGPNHLSELAITLPFAKRYVSQLPPDWLKDRAPEVGNPGYATMQIWSRLAFAEVIGNILNKRELTQAAIQATSELLIHIDERIAEERLRGETPGAADNFLRQLLRQRPQFGAVDDAEYFNEVRTILADLIVTISINIAQPFSKAIQSAVDFGFNLAWLVPELDKVEDQPPGLLVERLAYELLRLFPSAPAIYRRCEVATTLPSGAEIKQGEWVACLLPIAGQDPEAFPEEPTRFSLGHGLPKKLSVYGKYERKLENYMVFGPAGGVHRCWGEALGKLVLVELFRAAARFPGLTRAAGPAGQVVELPTRMDYSLKLKFHPYDPNRRS